VALLALYASPCSFRKVLKPGLQFLGSFKAAIAEMTTVTTPNSKRNFMISIFGSASSLSIKRTAISMDSPAID
jgi:hypothetical protein